MSFNENQYQRPFSYPSTAINSKSLREGEENNKRTKQKIVNKPHQNSLSLSKTGIMKRQLRKAQNGAEQQGAQQQIEQLVGMFAEIVGQDPEELMQELAGMEPEAQKQAVQQMEKVVMEGDPGQGQPQGGPEGQPMPEAQAQGQGQPAPPPMRFGGPTHRMPDGREMAGASHNPNAGAQSALDNMAKGGPVGAVLFDGNTIDFDDVRKNLIKMYKKGGETKEALMDTSSTEAYTSSLKEVFKKKMFLGKAIGSIQNAGKGAPQFQQLPPQMPTAKDGIVVGENGMPTWDGEELTPYMKEKYGFTTMDELYARDDDYYDIIEDANREIFENSDYGKKAIEQGITFDQVNQYGENYTNEIQTEVDATMEPFVQEFKATEEAARVAEQDRIDSEVIANITDLDLQQIGKTRAELDAMTSEEKQYLADNIAGEADASGYTGAENPDANVTEEVDADGNVIETPPVVLTPAEEKAAEDKRRAELTQEERDAEDKKNTETEYEEGKTYKYVDGKLTLVEEDGDASKGQADVNRVKPGHNAEGNGMSNRRSLNNNFLSNMFGIVNRNEVGVQGNMDPKKFQERLNQSGITDFKYKNNIFGQKLKMKFNPITGQQETVDEDGNTVTPEEIAAAEAEGNAQSQTDNEYDIQEGIDADLYPNGNPNDPDANTDAVVTNGLTRKQNRNRAFDTDRSGDIDKWERKDGRKNQRSANQDSRRDRRDTNKLERKQKRTDRKFGQGWQQNLVDSAGGKSLTANRNAPQNGEEQIQRGDENGVESNDPSVVVNAQSNQNDTGNEIDATYDMAEANLKQQGITNPTQQQLNDAIDDVELVRGMSKVPAGEMPPNFRYGGKTGGVYLPKAKMGNNDVAKFKPLYEYEVDYGAMADVLYEGGAQFNEFLEKMNTVMSPEEERAMNSTDRKFLPAGYDSTLQGQIDKQTGKDFTDNKSGGRLAGRSGDPIDGEGGQMFTKDFMGRSKKNGGLAMAKAGLQVGEELTLTPGQLKMMENLGFKVTQLY